MSKKDREICKFKMDFNNNYLVCALIEEMMT